MTFKPLFPVRAGFLSAVVFFAPVFSSAGEFRFTRIEVEVEPTAVSAEEAAPVPVKSVPTRVRVADAQIVSKVVISKDSSDASEKKVSGHKDSGESAAQEKLLAENGAAPGTEKKEGKESKEEPTRPMLIAPLQGVDLDGGEEIPMLPGADSPFNPPYIPRQEQAALTDAPGVLPPLDPLPLPQAGKSGQAPQAPPAALPVDLTKLPVQKALPVGAQAGAQSGQSGQSAGQVMASRTAPSEDVGDSYYSDLETDALLNGAESWRFVTPKMGSTW